MNTATRSALDMATTACDQASTRFRERDKLMAQVLALSDERDQNHKRLISAELAAYLRGYDDGRADQAAESDRAWAAVPVQRPRDEPSLDELELLRWGPGGRERFGDPRPGDYTGGAL